LKKIFLIGMMGAGKTTIGELLAKNLGVHFEDLDATIESIYKLSIDKIFSKYGERKFRTAETNVLLNSKAVIISCGGGIILNKDNRNYINKGISFFLNVDLNRLEKRLVDTNSRPLLNSYGLKEDLKTLWEKRESLYLETADYIINVNDEPPNEIAQKISGYIK